MTRLFPLAGLLTSALLSTFAFAADDDKFANVTMKTTPLTSSSYLLEGAGGNIGVVAGKDGLLIIDDQFAPLADKIVVALKAIGSADTLGQPRFVINTHFHGDHTGGNGHFGRHGTIMAHHNVLKRLEQQADIAPAALPVLTYDNGLTVHFNGEQLQLLHLGPGHTDGDTVVLWQNKSVVHMGDLFFKDRFPFIDLEGGGSVTGYRDNVGRMLEMINDDTKVIPGHGGLATKADLVQFKQMLDDCITWMQQGLASGNSLEQMKATPLPQKWQAWGWQFIPAERWVDTLYQGLSGHSE
ncbi:MBL fold metallo-hydrolase [Shewanella sedimentimangrovi]|uniref:beta-lactamase n=1 Tax=Shewanella sedimentimangrovi TaxID=2814293 RepID=A0ABX7R420_9GAMM|nr:MBL fold metallo-hydrolase [Shewanella sedimentimangrovi]QSX38581.1 MBL fold metallo-hydrolase [Shewanella sedimentimangrovi]